MNNVHPELIDPEVVFVTKFPINIKSKDLTWFFSNYVRVKNVVIKSKHKAPFAFVTLHNESDAKKLLTLSFKQRCFRDVCLRIRPAKKEIKLPGCDNYARTPLNDLEFDLEPETSELSCIHVLPDEIVLNIFDSLPVKDIIRLEKVCRRWQSLVYAWFKRKAHCKITDITQWMFENLQNHVIPATERQKSKAISCMTKLLILCGLELTSLSVGNGYNNYYPSNYLKVIGQLCPNLESLSLGFVTLTQKCHVEQLARLCPKLKEFEIVDNGTVISLDFLRSLFKDPIKLETLTLNCLHSSITSVEMLPPTLKKLSINGRIKDITNQSVIVAKISERCPELEVLNLMQVLLTKEQILEVGRKCSNLTEFSICLYDFDNGLDLSSHKNLKILRINGEYNLSNIVENLPLLEELVCKGSLNDTDNAIDFAPMNDLKILELPGSFTHVSINNHSIKTLASCQSLEKLTFAGSYTDFKVSLFEIIKKCKNLKDLKLPGMTITPEAIPELVDANKNRNQSQKPLNLWIGMNEEAFEKIEALKEGNFDVRLYGDDDLFLDYDDEDFFDEFYDDDDFYDDLSDDDVDEDINAMFGELDLFSLARYHVSNGYDSDADSDGQQFETLDDYVSWKYAMGMMSD